MQESVQSLGTIEELEAYTSSRKCSLSVSIDSREIIETSSSVSSTVSGKDQLNVPKGTRNRMEKTYNVAQIV